jgi:hypothetical protein
MPLRGRLLTLTALLGLLGCEGLVTDPAGEGPPEEVDFLPPPDPDVDGDGQPDPQFHFFMNRPVSSPGLRMLTPDELAATLEDLTGVSPDLSAHPAPLTHLGLENDASRLTVRDARHMQALFETAHDVALRADLERALPCLTDPCADREIADFLRRAFVREVDPADYVAIYRAARESHDHDFGRRAVIQSALRSPSFLYRTELGDGAEALTAPELARKLSYFLWGTMPDEALRAAAFDGSLARPGVYESEVDRLLADPRARAQVVRFVFEWLGLSHFDLDAKAGSDALPEGLEASMRAEARMMIEDVLERGAPLTELFERRSSFVDARLAAHYGLDVEASDELQPVSLEGTQRRGILTTALVLAAHAKEDGRSPMQRGYFLVNELLCHDFPAEAGTPAMELGAEELGFRERFTPLETTAPCSYCHRTLNAGFAFDVFDPVGRRWPEDEVPLSDAVGFFDLPPYERVEFSSPEEAARGFAQHEALPRCFVTQLYRSAQGRTPGIHDRPTLESLQTSFEASEQRILALARAIALSDAFRRVNGDDR